MQNVFGEQSMPLVGVWYHYIAKNLPELDRRMFCLCVQIDAGNPSVVSLCVRIDNEMVLRKVNVKRLKVANWLRTNRFHLFCLKRLREILESGLSLEELEHHHHFQLYFDFATQYRVYRAKKEHHAIDCTYDIVAKKLKDALLTLEEKVWLKKAHEQLINDYLAFIEHRSM
jgi:hypothetical protein